MDHWQLQTLPHSSGELMHLHSGVETGEFLVDFMPMLFLKLEQTRSSSFLFTASRFMGARESGGAIIDDKGG